MKPLHKICRSHQLWEFYNFSTDIVVFYRTKFDIQLRWKRLRYEIAMFSGNITYLI